MSEPRARSADPTGRRRFDSTFNWVWLAEFRDDRAVEVLDRRDAADPRLERLFGRVDRCRVGPGPFELGVADGRADVVILHDRLPRLASRLSGPASARRNGDPPDEPEVAILAECRRVLREGGLVQLMVENSMWHRRLRRSLARRGPGPEDDAPGAARPGTVRSWIRRAGFEEARVFYVSPRSGFPEGLIPSSGPALDAHERLRGSASGVRAVARRLLARTGLGSVLHPRILVLALA